MNQGGIYVTHCSTFAIGFDVDRTKLGYDSNGNKLSRGVIEDTISTNPSNSQDWMLKITRGFYNQQG